MHSKWAVVGALPSLRPVLLPPSFQLHTRGEGGEGGREKDRERQRGGVESAKLQWERGE